MLNEIMYLFIYNIGTILSDPLETEIPFFS